MKRFELVKRDDHYGLYNEDGHKIAATIDGCNSKLSKENCDEIFGVIDVDKLTKDLREKFEIKYNIGRDIPTHKGYYIIRGLDYQVGVIDGFNKAIELQKDKLFTVEDMQKLMYTTIDLLEQDEGEPLKFFKEFIQSLQQPTEIEVEIAVLLTERDGGVVIETPKLDENGCLILKRI